MGGEKGDPFGSIPLFAGLPANVREELQSHAEVRDYLPGQVVLRRGERGSSFCAILAGAVSVRPRPDSPRAATLGAGEVFGEMSLLSGEPISATITAERATRVVVVPRRSFETLFADEPSFRDGVAELLAARLRKTSAARQLEPEHVLIGVPPGHRDLGLHIASVVDQLDGAGSIRDVPGANDGARLAEELAEWREKAGPGERRVWVVPVPLVDELAGGLRARDAVLVIDDAADAPAAPTTPRAAQVATLRVGSAARRRAGPAAVWSYRLGDVDDAEDGLVIARVARWIARREIGVALSAGAARGFAHLGVLSVLEEADVPVDCLAGSSIGGIVALLYALSGSAAGALQLAEETIGSNERIRDVSLLPRSSLFAGKKIRRNAERIAGGVDIGDLTRPAVAIATDLIRGERVLLDRGPVATALVATAAMPGLLPPVESGARRLVDGALVSRVPVDELEGRRCGLRIAVSVLPNPSAESDVLAADLTRSIGGPLGLGRVIARSWDLLGFWHGASDAQAADVVIEPCTPRESGYDFDAFHAMVAAGRTAAEQELPAILRSARHLVRCAER
ncbi:MAG: cyclic nucleotide-binding domain-containing protein [bacterium]|nr:cyclic nucleotide-binding domain-containing protein [bacterium]